MQVGDGVVRPDARRPRQHRRTSGLDYLVTIGGDDTLCFSRVLVERGVPLIAIPKTMDNDVQGTEYCIGFSSAITRAKELINRQRTTLGCHERIGVFRIFGRDAGFTALYTAYVTSARCLIPEAPYDLDALARGPRRGPPQTTRATTRSSSPPRARSGRARRSPTSARPTRSATATRRTSARCSRARSRQRTGIEARRVRADLRPALAASPTCSTRWSRSTFANIAMDLDRGRRQRPDGRRSGTASTPTSPWPRPPSRRAASARRLQRGAVPPAVRRPAGRAAAATPSLGRGRRADRRSAGSAPRRRARRGAPAGSRQPSRPESARIARARADMSSSPWPARDQARLELRRQRGDRQRDARLSGASSRAIARSLRWSDDLKPSG